MKNKIIGWVCLLLALSLTSCRYQAGYPRDVSGKSVFLYVENRSLAAQFGPLLNRMIKEELLRAGVHRVADDDSNSNLTVRVVVQDYRRSPQAYDPSDTLLASGFELQLRTRVEIRSKKTEPAKESFVVESQGYVMRANSLNQPKDRQALSELARDLASRIVSRLINHPA